MFYFEKFLVYQKAKKIHLSIKTLCRHKNLEYYEKDQLARASLSIMLNIAEGTGKHSKKEKINFYIISRGSIYECVAILQVLQEEGIIDNEQYLFFFTQYKEVVKMLSKMINTLRIWTK